MKFIKDETAAKALAKLITWIIETKYYKNHDITECHFLVREFAFKYDQNPAKVNSQIHFSLQKLNIKYKRYNQPSRSTNEKYELWLNRYSSQNL
jgi:hypothetical protein